MKEVAYEQKSKQMDKRALTSMFMFFSFILLPISGIIIHSTHGALTTLNHFAMSAHNIAAVFFGISVVMHLSMNWRAMTKYMTVKALEYRTIRKEMIVAAAVVCGFVLLFSSHALHVR
ncbi:MAG TPA: DUF4405 domain-containing protein [Ignavibacteriales bacterium]|nr:DUF4405 domain-containing protein [Ignavibacteriales bacterium]